MKKLLFIVIVGLLSACSIQHEVSFNQNNDGHYKVILDLSEMMKKMGKLKEKDKNPEKNIFGKPNPHNNDMTMVEYVDATDGISNTTQVTDTINALFGLEFDFNSPEALNVAINKMKHHKALEQDSLAELGTYTYFEFDSKQLIVRDELDNSDEDDESAKSMQKMFKEFGYTWDLSFEKTVKKVDSKLNYELNENDQHLIFESNFDEMMNREEETIATITFK